MSPYLRVAHGRTVSRSLHHGGPTGSPPPLLGCHVRHGFRERPHVAAEVLDRVLALAELVPFPRRFIVPGRIRRRMSARSRPGRGWRLPAAGGVLLIVLSLVLIPVLQFSFVYVLFLGILLLFGGALWRSAARSPLRGVSFRDPRMAHVRDFEAKMDELENRRILRMGAKDDPTDTLSGVLAGVELIARDLAAERKARKGNRP